MRARFCCICRQISVVHGFSGARPGAATAAGFSGNSSGALENRNLLISAVRELVEQLEWAQTQAAALQSTAAAYTSGKQYVDVATLSSLASQVEEVSLGLPDGGNLTHWALDLEAILIGAGATPATSTTSSSAVSSSSSSGAFPYNP